MKEINKKWFKIFEDGNLVRFPKYIFLCENNIFVLDGVIEKITCNENTDYDTVITIQDRVCKDWHELIVSDQTTYEIISWDETPIRLVKT